MPKVKRAIKIWFFANNFFHRRGTPPNIPPKWKEGVAAHLLMVWLFQKKLKIMCHFVPKFEKVPISDVLAYISVCLVGTSACNSSYERACQDGQFDVFGFGFGRGCDVIATSQWRI